MNGLSCKIQPRQILVGELHVNSSPGTNVQERHDPEPCQLSSPLRTLRGFHLPASAVLKQLLAHELPPELKLTNKTSFAEHFVGQRAKKKQYQKRKLNFYLAALYFLLLGGFWRLLMSLRK